MMNDEWNRWSFIHHSSFIIHPCLLCIARWRPALLYSARVAPMDRAMPSSPCFARLPTFSPTDWGMRLSTVHQPLHRVGVLLALAVLGCGQNDKLTPVRGQVFFHGQPLCGGTIVFTPDAERGGHGSLACGEIDAEGRYSLHTGDRLGVAAGWHRVTIAPPALAAAPGRPATPPAIDLPRTYSDPEQSGLLREVQPGKSGEQDFHLE
jgi:hypothetical protein